MLSLSKGLSLCLFMFPQGQGGIFQAPPRASMDDYKYVSHLSFSEHSMV